MLFNTNRKTFILYSLLLIAGLLCIEFAEGQDCTGVVPTYQSRGVILCGGSYPLPSGKTVSQSGTYLDTLRYTTGCDSVIFTIVLDKKVVITNTKDASICDGYSYMLPSGKIVKLPGSYKDVIKYPVGCDSLVTFVNLDVLSKTTKNTSVTICAGQPYALPSGKLINSPGIYSDTLYYTTGCDSLINIITVSETVPLKQSLTMAICAGNSLILPSGIQVANPGTYYDTIKYKSGCDSLITEVDLFIKPVSMDTMDVHLCQGKAYTLPWGLVIDAAGMYRDTLHYLAGCDSLIRLVQVTINTPAVVNSSVKICSGASYTLPSGLVVTVPGIYKDTLHDGNGCDSIIRVVTVSIQEPSIQILDTTICEGNVYILPWGNTAIVSGTYTDTLHYTSGCDSLIRSVRLKVKTAERKDSSITMCTGQTFVTASGKIISLTGTYFDTLRYTTGCDSTIYRLSITDKPVERKSLTEFICDGGAYILPSGNIINSSGSYYDTLRYTSGCDSVIYTIQLISHNTQRQNITISICSGQTYTLPWGTIVSVAGIYRDTLRYASGCDSVIQVVDLSVNTPAKQSIDTSICFDAIYTLPWGTVAALPGIYTDTLHAIGGCDSLIRIVNLSIAPRTMKDTAAVICNGQFFLSPSGNKIYTSGLYSDTLRYSSGCDSMIFRISITIKPTIYKTIDAVVCSGNWFTTPSGKNLSTAGIYLDTLQYTTGCDSLITTINLSALTAQTQNTYATVCAGKSFTLPWGTVVTAPGIYRDTLKFISGCDSAIRIVQVSNYAPTHLKLNSGICAGQVYIFPSGKQVTTTGNFSDTIHNTAGCDSLIYDISLTSLTPVTQTFNVAICPGNSYTLPWGIVENSAGVYRDTVRSESGCDSLYRVVNLAISVPVQKNDTVSICDGVGYSLPSGKKVFASGFYRDTIFSASGCDSLITNLILIVQTALVQTKQVSICSGQVYTLPSGNVVNAAGNYRDTLKYTTGCDSLIQIINVQTITGKTVSTTALFCRGENYILPWGTVVNDPGHYSDTLRSNGGCDSLIYVVNLSVKEKPLMSVTKSNDINCTLGSARLTVTGGHQYLWSPATGLDRTDVFNPVAAPAITTLYHVQATSTYGCSTEDSILVLVTTANSGESFLMPNAFTPNGDNVNDYFGVQHWGAISDLHFSIYDRWGKLVFYTENPSQRWDGNIKDKLLPSGTYVYAITAKTLCGDVVRKGTVTLIR